MGENTTLNAGAGGDVIATDELTLLNGSASSGVKVQRMKVGFGADNSLTDVSAAAPLPVTVGNFPALQPVSAAALPLPAGAATAAAQTTGNASLAAISGQLPATLGPKTSAASFSVTFSSDITPLAVVPNITRGAGAADANTQRVTLASDGPAVTALSSMDAKIPALGQALMAVSAPVVIASNQSAIAVAPNITRGAGVADANTQRVTLASDGPATTALTSIDTKTPAVGQALMAASLPVVFASNQSALPVNPDSVADSLTTTNSVLAAANVVSVPTAGFGGGSFHVTNAGVTCTITYEQSNDNVNWVTLPVVNIVASSSLAVTTSTATGLLAFATTAAFVRARVSTYTSGTVTVSLTQKRNAPPITGVSLAGSGSTIGALSSGTNSIGNVIRVLGYTDSVTALGSGATFTGTGRAITVNNYTKFSAIAYADQAGTLYIEQSLDTGATYQPIATAAVAAGGAAILSVPAVGLVSAATLYRVRFINGATLQTVFRLSSSFTAA